MTTRYGKPNQTRTAIDEWYTLGRPFTGPWGYDHNPTQAQMESVGWLVYVAPILAEHERVGAVDIINQDHVTNNVEPWSQEEIDAHTLREANEAFFVLTEANAELSYWVDKTPQEVTDIIANAPNTFASFKQMIEKNAQSIRAITIFLKLMRDTGRLG